MTSSVVSAPSSATVSSADVPASADAELATVRPAARAPSVGWLLKRAVLGLTIMFAVTGLAAYIANASIDPSADGVELTPSRIAIGLPAAQLLKKH